MNLIIDLKGYDGTNSNTCTPNFGRSLQYIGIDTSEEIIQEVTIPASSTVALFSVLLADAKKFLYLEATAECDIIVNGGAEVTTVKPIVIGTTSNSGVYFTSSELTEISITNNAITDMKVYFVTAK